MVLFVTSLPLLPPRPLQEAVDVMTQVAEHINDMKKEYDDTVRVQELQSLLHGWEVRAADLMLASCIFGMSECMSLFFTYRERI